MSRYVACPTDGTPIDTLTERQGRPAKYCSGACRQKAYRARRREERAAVAAAVARAEPGDTVLLAPAAASLDMYEGMGQRGDMFAAAARELALP